MPPFLPCLFKETNEPSQRHTSNVSDSTDRCQPTLEQDAHLRAMLCKANNDLAMVFPCKGKDDREDHCLLSVVTGHRFLSCGTGFDDFS